MDIQINGKHLDVGEALSGHVRDNLAEGVAKYFERAIDGTVNFSREGNRFRADISVHPNRGMVVQGRSEADDAYAAFDAALERIVKQLRRYKRKLKDHHKERPADEFLPAQYTIFANEGQEEEMPEDGQPAIVAELPHEISTLTVGEAVMRLDLADASAMMFRNRKHGGLNVVYRRPDGNIGWIDPSDSQAPQG